MKSSFRHTIAIRTCVAFFMQRTRQPEVFYLTTENKMGTEPVGKLIISMSLPPLLSMFMQYSYNLIDSAFVAQLSENALTAVSLSFPITTLMNAASVWIGVGINVLIAGFLGRKEQDKADNVATAGLIVSFVLGAVLNILALLVMKPYFRSFTDNADIYSLCIAYMQICAFMQVPNMVHIAIQKMLQATGNMISPMWFQIAGVVVNITFDPLLIFGMGPFPMLGITGAAIATVMGYAFSMVLALILLFRGNQKVRIRFNDFHFEWHIVRRIFSAGFPSFIMNALSSFTVTFANLFLVSCSETAVAFFGAYYKIQQLIVMTVNGLIQGCLPIMRYNYGAGKEKRVRSSFHYGLLYATVMMGVGELIVQFFPSQLLRLFAASAEMQSFGIRAMRIMACGFVFCGFTTMIATYFQATEKIIQSNILQLLRQLVVLLPAMWILDHFLGIDGIWFSFPVTEIISFLCAAIMLAMAHKWTTASPDSPAH